MDLERLVLKLPRDEAHEIRPLLRRRWGEGVLFSERRSWWLWTILEISGPPAAMRGVRMALDDWATEKLIQDAW